MDGGRGWRRLAEQIRAEMPARYETVAQLARAAQLSPRTIEELIAGRKTHYRDSTLYGVDTALGWEPGSALRVVQGGKPRRMPDPGLARLADAWPRLSERDKRILLAVLDALQE